MLRTFIQVMALGLTLIATYFLLKSSLALSTKDIAELSTTYFNSNPYVAKNLSQQQADTRIGFANILLSFIAQTINLLLEKRWKDFGVNRIGVIIAIFALILTFFISWHWSKYLSDTTQKDVENILIQDSKKP